GSKPFPIYADLEGNTSYLTSAFFKVGGWDDEIRFGGGGVDLSRRLLDVEPDLRRQIYSPDPVILHDYAKNQEHYDQKRSKQKKSHARLRRKHPDYGRFLSMWAQFRGNHSLLIHKASNKKKIKYKPFISICIPTYNRADFIISGINSALRQTYKNFEIIIVDDGSTDDTKTIINKFNNKNIKYILKNHSGAPETRNICIANAKGDYILWLDSDDLISETLLEEYVEIINKINDIDVVYSNHFCVDMDGYIINKYTHFDWYNKNQEMILRFLTKNPLPNLGTLVKKSLYDELGGYNIEFPRAHDMEFWSRVALANKYKCKHLNKYLNYIRIHDRNITGLKNPIKTNFEYEVKITKKIINEIGIENIYYNQANKEISKQVAYAKVVDRFMELYAFKEVESYCNEYLAFHRNNSVFLDKKNILRETVANFILHYHIFKFLKKIKHSPIIDEYYNFVSSKIISFSDYNSQINFNMSQAITALTEQAHKYFLKKEYYISIYLYHGLLMLDENNIDLLKIISTLYMMIENYGSAINYLERACAIESNNAEINSLLLRAREAISSRDKIYIS
ncbi:MAG: glycosyltransferase, partial [Bacteroidota bacterium]